MVPRNDITSTRKAEEEGQTDSEKERVKDEAPLRTLLGIQPDQVQSPPMRLASTSATGTIHGSTSILMDFTVCCRILQYY